MATPSKKKPRRKPSAPSPPRKAKRPPSKSRALAVVPPAAAAPVRKKMGRPTKLTRALIEEFARHLATSLHLGACAALVGVSSPQYTAWLKTGRDDCAAGRRTLEAEFSVKVRDTLAELQASLLTRLDGIEREALGIKLGCRGCEAKRGPCGKHRRNLKHASELTWKRLARRFPQQWNGGGIRLGTGGDGDFEGAGETAGEEGARPTVAAALVVFMPPRRDDDDV